MKKKLFTIMCFALLIPHTTYAKEPEFKQVEMTYYIDKGTTADGSQTREGICAFRKKEIGLTAIVYENNNGKVGDLIGIYEIKDTGYGREEENGKGTIQNGNCIDIFFENDSDGKEFIKENGNNVFIQLVDAKG